MSDKIDDKLDAVGKKAEEVAEDVAAGSASETAAAAKEVPPPVSASPATVPDKADSVPESPAPGPVIAPESPPKMKDSPAENSSTSTSPAANNGPRKGSSAIAWLALLLVLGVAGAAVWVVQQGMDRESQLGQRLTSLEAGAGRDTAELSTLENKLSEQFRVGLKDVKAEVVAEDERQAQLLDALDVQQRQQQDKLSSYSANDHDSWRRAEVQYLLRLANQRLIMAGDVVSAQALLGSADTILRQLNDPSLHEVRAALAAEQAALRAVPKIDVEGLYLRLSALVEQADKLVIFQMREAQEQPALEASDDWQVRLERGYEEAARKLSDYVVIRRRDVPMHALMDPQWEGLVRQNLRMLMEQAQVALLSGNQTLYRESLKRSQHWVAQFFDTDEAASRAMAREITQLEGQTIAVIMPDLGRSMQALDEAVKNRLQQGGAE